MVKIKRLTAIFMAALVVAGTFPTTVLAEGNGLLLDDDSLTMESGQTATESGSYTLVDEPLNEEGETLILIDERIPAEEEPLIEEEETPSEEKGTSINAEETLGLDAGHLGGQATRSYSCPFGGVHNFATSASFRKTSASDYTASWGWTMLGEIKDGNVSYAYVYGQFDKRPVLGDRVRTRVGDYPSHVHVVAYIISGLVPKESGHTRGGYATTDWTALVNNYATFSGIAYY